MRSCTLIIFILIMNVPALAMTTLNDVDLSEVANPLSLGLSEQKDVKHSDKLNMQVNETTSYEQDLLKDDANGKNKIKDKIVSEENSGNITTNGDEISHTLEYPDGQKINTSNTYKYHVIFNNTEMRDTFINQRNTDVHSGSWIDIKIH